MKEPVERFAVRGLSKAEIEELATLLGVRPEIHPIRIENGALVVVTQPKHQLGEPFTLLAVWVLVKKSKLGQRAAALFDSFTKGRQSLSIKQNKIIYPDGRIEFIAEIEAKGEPAVGQLLKKAEILLRPFDANIIAAAPTIEAPVAKECIVKDSPKKLRRTPESAVTMLLAKSGSIPAKRNDFSDSAINFYASSTRHCLWRISARTRFARGWSARRSSVSLKLKTR